MFDDNDACLIRTYGGINHSLEPRAIDVSGTPLLVAIFHNDNPILAADHLLFNCQAICDRNEYIDNCALEK